MKIEANSVRHMALKQLLALTASSNASLFRQATGLGVIKEGDLELKSFHYHVKKLKLRDNALDHLKRKGMAPEDRQLPLAGCRLYSSPRLNFSVRLMIFAYEADPDEQARTSYGVLAVAQELCSGLMRAEVLASGFTEHVDLCRLELGRVITFIAKAITLPKLKVASVHFPQIRYRPTNENKPQGLIAAWLGYEQPSSSRSEIECEFSQLSQACVAEGDWGGLGHKLQPTPAAFFADFPPGTPSDLLDLTRPCGKPWWLRTVVKEVNRRLDRWNVEPPADDLSPAIRIWLARQCYYKVQRFNEKWQSAALSSMCKDVLYRKRTDDEMLSRIATYGINHVNNNDYPIYK